MRRRQAAHSRRRSGTQGARLQGDMVMRAAGAQRAWQSIQGRWAGQSSGRARGSRGRLRGFSLDVNHTAVPVLQCSERSANADSRAGPGRRPPQQQRRASPLSWLTPSPVSSVDVWESPETKALTVAGAASPEAAI